MATINDSNMTLLDLIKRKDPNGAPAKVVEVLQKMSPVVEDATFVEGNLETGHRFTTRTGLPSVAWRQFNKGNHASKSRTAQIDEACGRLGGMSKVDVELANLGGNPGAARASEDTAFMQALTIEAERSFFYSSTKTTPDQIHGLAPRLDSTTAPGGTQIIKHDSSASGADQTSVWFIGWGPETVFGIYPKGSTGGLQHKNLGEQLTADPDGGEYLAYVTDWEWKLGVAVKDWRFLCRIANIDTGNLLKTGDALIVSMIEAYHRVENTRMANFAWYVNRTIATYLHLQARDSVKNSTLSIERVEGRPVLTFMGFPVRVTDALINTEAAVS